MSVEKVFSVLDIVETCYDDLDKITEDICNSKFEIEDYTKTIDKLDAAGRKLKGCTNKSGKLIGVKILELVKVIRRYKGTIKDLRGLENILNKLIKAFKNKELLQDVNRGRRVNGV